MPSLSQPASQVPSERRSFIPKDISHRQLQRLFWVQEGKSATDIGAILGISGRTVDEHLARVCRALGVRTRTQAVVRAVLLGLL